MPSDGEAEVAPRPGVAPAASGLQPSGLAGEKSTEMPSKKCKAAGDLQILLDERQVPQDIQQLVIAKGYDVMSRFSLMADTKEELKSIFVEEWGLPLAANRLALTCLADAWRCAQTRVAKAEEAQAEARAVGEKVAQTVPQQIALRRAIEAIDGDRLPDKVFHILPWWTWFWEWSTTGTSVTSP